MVEGSPLAPALYALISDAQLHRITLGLLSVVVHYFSQLLRHLQFTFLTDCYLTKNFSCKCDGRARQPLLMIGHEIQV